MTMPKDDRAVGSVELYDRRMDAQGWLSENVVLARMESGDIILRADTSGRAVETVMGDFYGNWLRIWTVRAADVPRMLDAAVRDLFSDTSGFIDWLRDKGIATEPTQWHGFRVRPVPEDRLLLEAVRAIIGTRDRDDATLVGDRFADSATAKGIEHTFTEKVSVYD
jgi:hypothetical protein